MSWKGVTYYRHPVKNCLIKCSKHTNDRSLLHNMKIQPFFLNIAQDSHKSWSNKFTVAVQKRLVVSFLLKVDIQGKITDKWLSISQIFMDFDNFLICWPLVICLSSVKKLREYVTYVPRNDVGDGNRWQVETGDAIVPRSCVYELLPFGADLAGVWELPSVDQSVPV